MPKRKSKSQSGKGVLSDIHRYVKSNKLISRGLALIPHPYAQTGSKVASMLGYGKKKSKRKTSKSKNVVATSAVPRVRKSRYGSGKVMMGRGQTGSGFLNDLGSGLGNFANGLGHGIGGIFH